MWGDISLCSWFAFPWWSVMLNIFSYTCWPFVCLLWENIYLVPLPTFKLDFFCCWFVWVSYIFWILPPYQIYDLHIFFPLCALFCWYFLFAVQKLFSLMYSHLFIFAFVAVLLVSYPKIIAKTNVQEFLPHVFF